jgi:hypothetical protein
MTGAELNAWARGLDAGNDDEAMAFLGALTRGLEPLSEWLLDWAQQLGDVPGDSSSWLLSARALVGDAAHELDTVLRAFARHERG